MQRYKVIYHDGPELTLMTRVKSGILSVGEESLSIVGDANLDVPFTSITRVALFRQHGLGRMLKLHCNDRSLFVTVVRINLFGYFAIVNYLKAGELYEILKRKVPKPA